MGAVVVVLLGGIVACGAVPGVLTGRLFGPVWGVRSEKVNTTRPAMAAAKTRARAAPAPRLESRPCYECPSSVATIVFLRRGLSCISKRRDQGTVPWLHIVTFRHRETANIIFGLGAPGAVFDFEED